MSLTHSKDSYGYKLTNSIMYVCYNEVLKTFYASYLNKNRSFIKKICIVTTYNTIFVDVDNCRSKINCRYTYKLENPYYGLLIANSIIESESLGSVYNTMIKNKLILTKMSPLV
jgi:hypothetical protein